ncbi:MAG TPA: hypothetical protein VGK94_11770 [Candidatus Polarisedimenticolia bacterium]
MSEAFEGEAEREAAGRKLRVTLVAGSLYDFTFAIINLAAPGFGSWFLEIPMPGEQIYLRFIGVFLVMAALFYMLPAIHPGRYLGNVVVAIVGRGMGAVFLIAAVLAFSYPPAFLLLGAGDLIFALLHLYYLARAGGGNPFRHYFE